tara:strand:- start:2539 stop:3618 length:1080 start_codon:yes stop_codon:yes gene_type:complete
LSIKVGIVSAEPSGDLLGSKLIEQIKDKFGDIEVIGIGDGDLLQYGTSKNRKIIEVMGFIDPLKNFLNIKKFQKKLIKQFKAEQIDIFIGIDAPDFNFGIHKELHRENILTVHVVCPSVWAWRKGRAKKFKFIDYMLCLFPFELDYCKKVNKEALCIGHPLYSNKNLYVSDKKDEIVCLLPGSRKSEIEHHLPLMIKSFNLFSENKKFKAIIPAYDQATLALINTYIKNEDDISSEVIKAREILKESNLAICCSGTATLECMLAEIPTTVVYKTDLINYWIYKILVNAKFVALPNLIAGKQVMRELLQNKMNVENIVADLKNNFENKEKISTELKKVSSLLTKPNFSEFLDQINDYCRR